MRFHFVLPLLAALAVVLAVESQAQAGHCGATACCPTDCCVPKVRYKTCYQTVKEVKQVTCYETVRKTIMKDVVCVECKPVYEKKDVEVTKIICEPRYEDRVVKVCVRECKIEHVVVPGKCRRKLVREEGCCYVDPCTGCTRHTKGRLTWITCKEPDRICEKKVWVPREEERTVKVCIMERKEVKEKVQVTTCRMERIEVKKQVPVTICEKVPVVRNVEVCRRVKVCVPVVECCKPSLFDRLKAKFHRCDDCCYNGAPAPVKPEPIKVDPMPK